MDSKVKKYTKDNFYPKKNAGLLSHLTFFYNYQILKKGSKKDIEENDIFEVLPAYQAKRLGDKLETLWNKDKKPSVISCLTKCFGWTYAVITMVQLIFSTLYILYSPIATSKFIAYFQKGQTSFTTKDACYYGVAIFGLNLLNVLFNNHLQQTVIEYALRVRTALTSLIYRKCLRLSPAAFAECSVGKIVSLISKDVFGLDWGLANLKDLLIAFIQLIVVTYILYQRVGVSAIPAIGFIIAVIPLQMIIGKFTTQNRIRASKKADRRFKFLQETINAIKIIKMYTWQKYFENLLHKARIEETDKIKIVYYFKALIVIIGSTSVNLAFYILLVSYIARGYSIEAETIYYVQTCLGAIKITISIMVPFGISQTADMVASLKRVQAVLDMEEVDKKQTPTSTAKPSVHLNKIKVIINGQEVIESVSLDCTGGLTLIAGNVGSGKSTLLKTILGEYKVAAGELITHGTFSYASQEPWLFPSTIRQNILFGQDYNEKRYQEVLNVCALTYDINQFEKLDQTIVGDNGFNLSKGQQARINLARAVYKNSDIYLLDDSLRSLDNHVSSHIFNECIKGFLKNKMVLLVTNNINHIKEVGNVLFIKDGVTLTLEQQNDALDKRITYYIDEEIDDKWKRFSRISRKPTINEIDEEDYTEDDVFLKTETNENINVPENLYHEEKKDGKVLWSVYIRYFRFIGGAFVVLSLFIIFIIAQFCMSYSEKVISKWVNLEPIITEMTISNQSNTDEYKAAIATREHFLNLYTVLIVGLVTLLFVRTYTCFTLLMNGARKLHQAVVSAMLNAYMYFFDNHFIGNILNRLSKDFFYIDEVMPFILFDCFRLIFNISGVFILVASVNWVLFIPSAVLLLKCYLMRRLYLPTGRSLRRLEASTRSPMIGYMNSTLEGLAVIRASEQQNQLQVEFDKHQDLFTATFYMNQNTFRFFTFVLDISGVFLLAGLIVKFLLFFEGLGAGDVGLALTQVTILSALLQQAIKQITEVEYSMTSVERILEYADVTTEPKTGQVLSDWPREGDIRYSNVSLTYKSDGHPVLKNISLNIEARSKVGIVGRTGAGKSSIISTLFRLYDFEGQIFIDGENISTLALDYLRSKISIIPQDPVMFSGTVRSNLDPFDMYTDADIWITLDKVHMKPYVSSLNQLITDVSTTFSSGQRQLICLARALLQNNKIVVLDEATASLDPETDQLLQKTVQESFKDCTVIIIAHKLNSVMNCDKILVLDAGIVVEFDEPSTLLANPNGFLSKMYKQE